jgi:hypothetical protein
MKEIIGFIVVVVIIFYAIGRSCSGNSYSYDDTPEYWESVNREQALKNAGLKGAADAEKRSRRLKMESSSRGGYNGSQQQQSDLDSLDKYMRENPNF